MSDSVKPVVHLVAKVKNDAPTTKCGNFPAAEDTFSEEPSRVTCRRCLNVNSTEEYHNFAWERAQEDHYGESLS